MSKIKIGDKVKCIKGFDQISVGMTGEIINLNNAKPPVGVKWDGLSTGHSCNRILKNEERYSGYYVGFENIELIEEKVEDVEMAKTFKVGDKVVFVKNLDDCDAYKGDTGIIESVDSDGDHKVRMDKDNDYWYVGADYLEVVVDKPVEVPVKFEIQEGAIGTYIKFNGVTICVPKGTPMGIAKKHVDDDDEPNDEVGRALAMYRMITDARVKGVLDV